MQRVRGWESQPRCEASEHLCWLVASQACTNPSPPALFQNGLTITAPGWATVWGDGTTASSMRLFSPSHS